MANQSEYTADKLFLPYQQELVDAIDTNQVVVVEKSRRTGYSWAASMVAVLTSSAKSGQSAYYMGYDLEMAREFIDYVGEFAKSLNIVAKDIEEFVFTDPEQPDKEIKAFRVEFASGHKVVALPSVARALRGKQGLVIIDEAAFHDDLEEVKKAAFALLIWGGKVLIVSTHNGEDNPFNDLVKDIRAGKSPYKLLRCTFDDALHDGLYKCICKKSGNEWSEEAEQTWRKSIIDFYKEDAEEELFCVPKNGSGTYLTRNIIEKNMHDGVKVVRYGQTNEFAAFSKEVRENIVEIWLEENIKPLLQMLNPNLTSSFGWDFGRSGDLTVLWVTQTLTNLSLETPFVLELRNMPHEQQKQILFYIIDGLPRFTSGVLDARGNGSYVAEAAWQKYGSGLIEQVQLTAKWYLENMPALKANLEDGTISLPKDADILADLRLIKMQKGIASIPEVRTKGSDGKKRHGDSAVALALAIYAAKREAVIYGYESYKDDKEDDENDWYDGGY